jgi:DUF1680 family protein
MGKLARREFLKAAPVAAGIAAYGVGAQAQKTPSPGASDPRVGDTPFTPVPDYPIQPQRHWDVTLTDGFWKPRVTRNADVTIPMQMTKVRADGGRGLNANVLEAAMLSLKTHPDPKLQSQVDAAVQRQLNSAARGNGGFEVAAARFQLTGQRDLLDHSIAAASALYDNFKTHDPPFSGGERDAMACVQLYRSTHDRQHLDLAKHYLDIRGLPNSVNRSRHNQSYMPVLEQSEAVGHAVNCVTLMVSLADVGVLTGLPAYFNAGHRMWADAVSHKMYVTGGVGATGNEGFGPAYMLPNISAYSETCAVLMFMTLNHRLFMATGDGKYIDVMERGMYNNAIDGVSITGNRFFYVNRLASAGDGRDARWEHASLECCPPNLVRFLAAMPEKIYAQDTRSHAIYVNLYVSSATRFEVQGKKIGLTAESEMPWAGHTRIAVSATEPAAATMKLRIPGWATGSPAPGGLYRYADASGGSERPAPQKPAQISVNGKAVGAVPDKFGYVTIARQWADGDAIDVRLPIETRRVLASDHVAADRRRVAIERGPIVYCAEFPDVAGGKALDVLVDRTAALTPVNDTGALGDIVVLETAATRVTNPKAPAAHARLIPYALWANRGVGEMSVWLSTDGYAVGDVGPAGGFIFYENPNYEKDGWRYLEAAPFDQSLGAKWGCFRRQIDGAKGTAIGTGQQNTADMVAACAEPESAAHLCANLSVNGVTGWFLPSRDELQLMYRNLKAKGVGRFLDGGAPDNVSYWASSQGDADMSSHVDFADLGRLHSDDKDFPRRVRAIRAI